MSDPYREIASAPSFDTVHPRSGITLDSRRREVRTSVIKRGKICFGPSLLDCIVLDVSPGGARVRMDVMVPLPETVILRFSGGSAFVSRIQWARGHEVGLGFERSAPMVDESSSSVARSAFQALPTDSLDATMRLLRGARFFDDPTLAHAAREAEDAYARFKETLKNLID